MLNLYSQYASSGLALTLTLEWGLGLTSIWCLWPISAQCKLQRKNSFSYNQYLAGKKKLFLKFHLYTLIKDARSVLFKSKSRAERDRLSSSSIQGVLVQSIIHLHRNKFAPQGLTA